MTAKRVLRKSWREKLREVKDLPRVIKIKDKRYVVKDFEKHLARL
jgi:hypothetical protein